MRLLVKANNYFKKNDSVRGVEVDRARLFPFRNFSHSK